MDIWGSTIEGLLSVLTVYALVSEKTALLGRFQVRILNSIDRSYKWRFEMRKKRKKGKSRYRDHARQRSLERFSEYLNNEDLKHIARMIQDRDEYTTFLYRKTHTCTAWLVYYKDHVYKVYYNTKYGEVGTVVKPSDIERHRFVLDLSHFDDSVLHAY